MSYNINKQLLKKPYTIKNYRRVFWNFGLLPVIILLTFGMQAKGQSNTPLTGNLVGPGSAVVNPLPAAYSTSAPVNLVRTWLPQKPYSTVQDLFTYDGDINSVQHTTTYTDGLDRQIQTVSWQMTPGGKDMIDAATYDGFGREQFQYLSYASPGSDGYLKLDPFGEQKTFYSTTYLTEQPAYENESYYYGHTNYEASPLNRVTSTFSPGNSWIGSEGSANPKSNKMQYLVNTGSGTGLDNVREWTIGFSALTYANEDVTTNVPVVSQVYPAGSLIKTVTINEKGSAQVLYTDVLGRVVLKKVQNDVIASDYGGYTGFLCTYYVYDDLGKMRFIITPKAVALMVANNSFSLTADMINELCFRFEYDARQRLMGKKAPGARWTYIVYDQQDRPVLMQDANRRQNNQWEETLYDNLNRPVETGILNFAGTPAGLQINNTTTTNVIPGSSQSSVPADLYIDNRQLNVAQYIASNSITIDNGFISETNASFTAQIVASNSQAFSNTVVTTANPIPLNCTGCTFIPLTVTNYDSYNNTSKSFINYSGNLSQGTNTYADPAATTKSALTYGMQTSVKVRVIEDPTDLTKGNWLESVVYYDDKGREVQKQEDNYKGGVDVETNLYNFATKVLCTYEVRNNASANVTGLGVKTNFNYDAAGRLLTVIKQLSGTMVPAQQATAHTVAQYSYDAMGRLNRKQQGQNTTGGPLEDQTYNYNIRGQLKGINWNYGNSPTTANVNIQNNKWFAMDLGYDWGFTTNQYDGNISGQRWMNASDGAQRAYGYSYDAAGRLLAADFNQNFTGSWLKSDPNASNTPFAIDYTVKMGDGINGSTAYDANGNIKQMQQSGLVLNSSQLIDNLLYNYIKVLNGVENATGVETNKLGYITDNGTKPAVVLGDFTKQNTGGGDDYGYDAAGNMITDLNKKMNGTAGYNQTNGAILYNYMGLPYKQTILDANNNPYETITYIYDADGNKLEKRLANSQTTQQTITSYVADFVYQNNVLQFFNYEEGRIRFTNNTTTPFAYDYYVQDHLGNTRVLLTEEQRTDAYPMATLESSTLSTENQVYNIPFTTPVSSVPGYPADNTTATNLNTQQLSPAAGTPTIGTGILLKVMAGDAINVRVNSWYKTNGASPSGNTSTATAIINALTSLSSGVPAASAGKLGTAELTSSALTPDITGANGFITNRNANSYSSTRPKAFLNVVLFDEQMRPVITNDGNNSFFDQVPAESAYGTNNNAVYKHIFSRNITKSGYLYIYVSNEDQNISVCFDNMQVTQVRGPLLESDDYYPAGLVMASISSKAALVTANKYLYQGKYNEFESETGSNQFKFRSYNPQLGRWLSADPADQFAGPYNGMGNNWPNAVDPDGRSAGGFFENMGIIAVSTLLASTTGSSWFEAAVATGGYAGASIASGSWDAFEWKTDAWKGTLSGELIAGATFITTGSAIAGKGAFADGGTGILGMSSKASQIALGASLGVLENTSGLILQSKQNHEAINANQMLGATLSGVINGAFQSKPFQTTVDGSWIKPDGLAGGILSNSIGAAISTAVNNGISGGWKAINFGDEFANTIGSAASQFSHDIMQTILGDGVKGKYRFGYNVAPNVVSTITQSVSNNTFTNTNGRLNNPTRSRPFAGVFDLNNTLLNSLPNVAGGWLTDTLFP